MAAGYPEELQALGVTGYVCEACSRDFRRAVVAKLFVTAFATTQLIDSRAARIA